LIDLAIAMLWMPSAANFFYYDWASFLEKDRLNSASDFKLKLLEISD
jgi:hypothetical protein